MLGVASTSAGALGAPNPTPLKSAALPQVHNPPHNVADWAGKSIHPSCSLQGTPQPGTGTQGATAMHLCQAGSCTISTLPAAEPVGTTTHKQQQVSDVQARCKPKYMQAVAADCEVLGAGFVVQPWGHAISYVWCKKS